MKWASVASIIVLVISCFFPWVSIDSRNIVVTGFHAEAIRFGQPAWIHITMAILFLFLLLLNKVWSLKTAFFVSAFNIAWAVRNFIALSSCSGGECPTKHVGLYAMLLSSILASVCMLFIERKVDETKA